MQSRGALGALATLPPIVPREFYARPADEVAPELLGMLLVSHVNGETRAGRITETEAYLGEADLASHASRGLTKRTVTMYGEPGTAYVYLIYGMHELLNAVCQPAGDPHAVLLRGVELIAAPTGARGDGPGRLTRALGITRAANGLPLQAPPVTVHFGTPVKGIEVTPRIGIDYAREWVEAPLRYVAVE